MASLCCGRSYALSPQLLIGLNRDTLTSLPPLWTSCEVFGRGHCEVIRLRCVRLQRQGPQTGIYIPIKTSTAELALETWWLNSHQLRKGHSVTRHAHILVMDFSLQAERKQVSDIGVMHFVKTAQDHLNNFAASWSLGALHMQFLPWLCWVTITDLEKAVSHQEKRERWSPRHCMRTFSSPLPLIRCLRSVIVTIILSSPYSLDSQFEIVCNSRPVCKSPALSCPHDTHWTC